jgi:putative hydrolase of the HAD superfamily
MVGPMSRRRCATTNGPSGPIGPINVVGLDGDDTLWDNEGYFTLTEELFADLVSPWAHNGVDLRSRLRAIEEANLGLFGYGIKGFTLSLVETAIDVTSGRVPAAVIQQLLDRGKEMLAHPVELLDGVPDVVSELADRYRLILVTKGDLIHQESKVARSGLASAFWQIEIISEKDPATYRRILERHGVSPDEFVMVGNSVRSDVLPVLAIGGRAVHVPYHTTWALEHAEHDGTVPTLASLRELPGWLATQDATAGR